MDQKINESHGGKSLFNVVPIGDNILVEVEFEHSEIISKDDLRPTVQVKVVGVGSGASEFNIGDILYFSSIPRDAGGVSVINPTSEKDHRYMMVSKYSITGIYTEMTPLKDRNIKKKGLDLVSPSAAEVKNVLKN